MIGSTLSHFRITAKLGEGGMGVVYQAEDIDLQRPVALKVLSKGVMDREDMRSRFLREARTAAALNHPNICTIYEVGQVDEVPFIAMELIQGRSLERLLISRDLDLPELLEIGRQIAEGLAEAHGAGIVHRDLKPANVMLNQNDRVKILDFGLAKPMETFGGPDRDNSLAQTITAEMTGEGTILGTVSHMSPEQAAGREIDFRSDIFSFGILLYEMATGRLPFRGDTPTSTMAKILESTAKPVAELRPDLPFDLDRVVRRCLEKDPEDRYSDTRELVADLRSLDSEERGETSEPAPPVAEESAPEGVESGELSSKGAWRWIALLAAVGIASVFLLRPWLRQAQNGEEVPIAAAIDIPSVAVLPFHDLSGDEENAYFSAGMTEEIISKLSGLEGIEVASRGSVSRYTDPARDPQQIGAELGVGYLLDGSVRRAGNQVRVSAQLVDAATGRNVWTEDFDGTLDDVFSMQEQTALEIAERFDLELSQAERLGLERRMTDNVAAYDAYLRGMSFYRGWGSPGNLEQAMEQFELALGLDPEFAAAMASLAAVHADMYRNYDTSEERIQGAEDLANRAIELDPTLADGSHALAAIAANRYDYHRASELFREAVRLAPKNSLYWENLAWSLTYQIPPDSEGAVAAAQEAFRLQPDYPGAYYQLGRALIQLGRLDEAREAFERSLELDPEFDTGYLGLGQYFLAAGDYPAALEAFQSRDSQKDTAISNFYMAAARSAAGDLDLAFQALERSFELGYRDFSGLEASAYFDDLRADPRYEALLEQYRGN